MTEYNNITNTQILEIFEEVRKMYLKYKESCFILKIFVKYK